MHAPHSVRPKRASAGGWEKMIVSCHDLCVLMAACDQADADRDLPEERGRARGYGFPLAANIPDKVSVRDPAAGPA